MRSRWRGTCQKVAEAGVTEIPMVSTTPSQAILFTRPSFSQGSGVRSPESCPFPSTGGLAQVERIGEEKRGSSVLHGQRVLAVRAAAEIRADASALPFG